MKHLKGALVLGLAASAVVSGAQSAAEWMRRSMQRTFPVNVSAVIVQRDPQRDDAWQTIRIDRRKTGQTRHVVLQPLRLQGIETVDDGRRLTIYIPDSNSLIVQDSPHLSPCDADWRFQRAKRNYTFERGQSMLVAGRTALTIVAHPRDKRMPVRTYFIDQEYGYPLRLTVEVGGKKQTLFDTRDIQFPDSLAESTFQIRAVGNMSASHHKRPAAITRQQVLAQMGFEPLVPSSPPMGFVLQEMQSTNGGGWSALAIRLTDGLVRATVYQWRPGERGARPTTVEQSSHLEVNGINLMLVSDLPRELREALLESFVERSLAAPDPRWQIGAVGPAPSHLWEWFPPPNPLRCRSI
jgi:outer membrane lipoprotein-sorting protein